MPSIECRATVSLLEWNKMDFGSDKTLSCVIGMTYSRGHSLASMKTECKQCSCLHWMLAYGLSQPTVRESKEEMTVI